MRIIVAGDFCPRKRVLQAFEQGDYSKVLSKIAPFVQQADYSIVNFECPIAEEGSHPIYKCGPNLRCSTKAIDAIKYAGFKCVTLANNHFRDYGDEGTEKTLSELKKNGIDYVGGGSNLKLAQEILYKDLCGYKVAIVNFCENEFSIAKETQSGSAPLCLIDNFKQITEARANADTVIVIVHGGHEGYELPSPRMKKTYRWFTDIGADVVINHHQHCYSGYENYNGKLIFYGLGNFCFDSHLRNDIWNEGYMVALDFIDDSTKFDLIPYTQCDEEPEVELICAGNRKKFDNKIAYLNTVIENDESLSDAFKKFIGRKKLSYDFLLSPYFGNSFLAKLFYRNMLPKFTSRDKLVTLMANIQCESHRDVIMQYFIDKQNDKE